MQEANRQVRKLTKVIACMEIVMDVNEPAAFVQLFVSIPGREGVRPFTWLLPKSGQMDATAYQDLVMVLERELSDGLSTVGGVQGVFPV